MTNLFRLDASIRIEGSVTREIADVAQAGWAAEHPGGTVTHREIGVSPLPSTLWATAIAGSMSPECALTSEQRAACAFAAALADEVIASDAYVFAVLLYYLCVAQSFKNVFVVVYSDPRIR